MHSWESKKAESAAEGIGRTDGIKSVEGIRRTDGIKSTEGAGESVKSLILIQNLFQAGSTSSAMWPEYFLSFSKRSTAAASVSLFLTSERSLGSNTLI